MTPFRLGRLMMTKGISDTIENNPDFSAIISSALYRHSNCDWGDMSAEDKAANNDAIKSGERILSSYKTGCADHGKIWIITEADRSVTTILFPEEY